MNFISYAQNFEDVMLHRALKDVDKGFYIDVGANDPVIDSVTKAFYDAGWRGINIEPVGQWYEKLLQDRPKDINLQVAVGARKGNLNFYEVVDTGLSTIDESIAKRHAKERGYELKSYKVPVARLTTICEQYPQEEIHFLKIDVEGAEHLVLKGLNLRKIRPWIILVESTLPNTQIENYEEWEPILLAADYYYVNFDGLNRFYVSKEHDEIKNRLAVPPNVFDEFILSGSSTSSFHSHIAQVQATLVDSQQQQQILEAALQETQQQCQKLDSQLQTAQAEVHQREEKLQEKETRLQELLLSLVEKETKIQEAAVTFAASKRQSQKLDLLLRTAEAEVRQSNIILHEKEEAINWLNNEWNAARNQLDEVHQSNHHWWLETDRLNKEIQTVYNSKSWRITWPLRQSMKFSKWLLVQPMTIFFWLVRLPKRIARWLLYKLIALALKRPRLKMYVMARLRGYPQLEEKLRRLACLNQPILDKPMLESFKSEPIVLADGSVVESEELLHLTPRACSIYAGIKSTIEKHQEGNF